ncbi:Mov34/MPN/PAD-1 family protein [Perilla frutescens var. frutescens]|nr:Mov34/MPN/PAD-1 family protein [Perilla frutescens var. frutescens]
MLKHGRTGVPMEVMGLMLGEFMDEYMVYVVDVFAMPQSGTGVSGRDLRWWLVGTTHILALDVGFLVLTSTLSSSIHDVEDDVQEQLLNTHSEKLAISFGLLNTKPGSTILRTGPARVEVIGDKLPIC